MEQRLVNRDPGGGVSRADLTALIERVESKGGAGRLERVPTGLPQPLDRLERGVLHEWLCGDEAESGGQPWTAPILVLAHLVRMAVERDAASGQLITWIGRRVWPQPHVLVNQAASTEPWRDQLLKRSLLVDPASLDDRLWAIDLCLRSEAVTVVVADVSEMRMAHSRRLQLAAETGGGLALLARPYRERREHSAAVTRWRIEPTPSPTCSPRWRVELVRCKGVQRGCRADAAHPDASPLELEHDHAAHCLRAAHDVADRSRAAKVSPAESRESIRRTA